MKQSNFTLFYFGIAVLFILFEALDLLYISFAARALLIPFLLVYYHLTARSKYTGFHRLIMTGLFFSWAGDIFMHFSVSGNNFLLSPSNYFLLALTSYIFVHLFYILAFIITPGKNTIVGKRFYQLLMILAYGAVFIWLVYNKLITPWGNFRIPVIVYTVLILFMLAAALNRYGKVNGVSYMLVAIGALLFVFSDSLLIINKFYEKVDFAKILILTTHIIAQYLIATGSLKQDVLISEQE